MPNEIEFEKKHDHSYVLQSKIKEAEGKSQKISTSYKK